MTDPIQNIRNSFYTIAIAALLVFAINSKLAFAHDHDAGIMCVSLTESSAMFDEPITDETEQLLRSQDPAAGLRFQLQGSRWTSTRTHPTIAVGEPFFLTYSFVLDGTSIPASGWDTDQNPRPCNLEATMDASFPGGFDGFRTKVREAFDEMQLYTNFRYVEVPDDGAAFTVNNNGTVPSATAIGRGDIRIAMRLIDGNGVDTNNDGTIDRNVLAYNRYPANGGDMVLDSGNMTTFADATNDFRRLKNTLFHENGHGLGLMHVMPQNFTKLMEPGLNTSFLGPQEDDIRAIVNLYGDPYESNNTTITAKPIGSVATGSSDELFVNNVAIERNGAVDYYRFNASGGSEIAIDLFPIGTTYQQGAQPVDEDDNPPLTTINALSIHNLRMSVFKDGQSLAFANSTSAGGNESVVFTAPADGTYVIKIDSTTNSNSPQRYEMVVTRLAGAEPEISVTAFSATTTNIESGDTFNFGSVSTDADRHVFFSVENEGAADLVLNGNPRVIIGGPHPQDFVVNLQPSVNVIAPGSSTNFNIGFSPSATGTRQAFVFINNNDDDESDFAFVVTGTGTQTSQSSGSAQIRVFQITPAFQFGKVEVTDGGFSDFPETFLGDSQAIFYAIENHGDADLQLTGNPIIDVQSGISGFTSLGQPNGQPIPAGNPEGFARSFRIMFDPSSLGTKTARVFINSNATNTVGQFDFTLRGVVVEEPVEIDDCNGNGIDDSQDLAGNDCNANGIPDECDADGDGDGVPDSCDVCDGEDDQADGDGDGVVDCLDECPNDAAKTEPGNCGCNVEETANCGIEVCPDGDDDFDGVCNSEDICPGKDDLLDLDDDGIFDCLDNDITPEEPGDTDNGNNNENDNTGDDGDGNDNGGNDNSGNNGNGNDTGADHGGNDGNGNDNGNTGGGNEENNAGGLCGSGAPTGLVMAMAFASSGSLRRKKRRRN